MQSEANKKTIIMHTFAKYDVSIQHVDTCTPVYAWFVVSWEPAEELDAD